MPENNSLAPTLEKALKGLEFGYVQLTVHGGQIVRVERVERIRLPSEKTSSLTGPTGSGIQPDCGPTP